MFAVWGYVISHQRPDKDGKYLVELNAEYLGDVLGEQEKDVAAVIEKLQQPDAKSRSKDEGGRKLVRLGEYTYWVVNGALYRKLKDEQDRRDYNRIKQAEWRARRDAKVMSRKKGSPTLAERNAEKREEEAAPEVMSEEEKAAWEERLKANPPRAEGGQ